MKKKILFIFNPRAGKGKIKYSLSDIIEIFNKNNYEVVTYPTKRKMDAKKIVIDCMRQHDYEYIVCSGGDGTLNEVINGVMNCNSKPKIGYIPSGTTNDCAYSLNLPMNIIKAANTVMDDELFHCDIGSFNEKYFVYNAAFGIFSDTAYQTPQPLKNILGKFAYILEGIKGLPNMNTYQMEIVCKDKIISDNFIFGMIANSNSVGGFRGITGKDVCLDDGKFEGMFIKKPHNIFEFKKIFHDLRKGNLNSDFIISFPVTEMCITSTEMIPWSIDGEYGGLLQTVHIKNKKQQIAIATKK